MGKIVILDENTSNKIAAGEVVERPASVVKELIENSIDAGASNILVEIKAGGISYIKIMDNGSGIEQDDVEIAFERHSTSKIRNANDLNNIMTLGFRGEALASIASVSTVQLTTRTAENEFGTFIEVKGGNIQQARQAGCAVGTTFVIRDLFYNTPARYKFLKKDTTEAGYISDIVSRIALARPDISFKLVINGSIILHSPGNKDMRSVIFSVYGKEFSKEIYPVDYSDGNIKVSGFVGKAEIARSNRNHQSFFINDRYFRSKVISSSLEEAYKTLLMKNKFPFAVLKLEVNPLMVDVNVHPTKMEVRFSSEQEIFRSIYNAASSALLSGTGVREVNFEKNSDLVNLDFSKVFEAGSQFQDSTAEIPLKVATTHNDIPQESKNIVKQDDEIAQKFCIQTKSLPKDLRIIGQLFSTYIVMQSGNEMLLLDQHAAHERVIYERLKIKFKLGKPMVQLLLLPVIITLTRQEYDITIENSEFLKKAGFDIEEFGNNSIMLRSIPIDGSTIDEKSLFLEVLDKLSISGNINEDIENEALYSIACRAAIKANKDLNGLEIDSLLKQLDELQNPFTCPHGRPTVISISKQELEKKFKRIV